MSLATRCTECGTVFRVVEDQLKVSEGWVRCGRCSAVFNALENLCEIEADPVYRPATTRSAAGGEPEAARRDAPVAADAAHDDDNWASTSAPSAYGPESHPEASADEPQPGALLQRPSGPALDTTEPFIEFPEPSATEGSPAAIVHVGGLDAPADTHGSAGAPATPQFLKAAERAAYWRRPGVRIALATGGLALALLLALQAAVAWRDLLAAHVPAAAPALTRWCEWTGCRITPLRRIDRLSVDSSGLIRLEGAALYRLTVVLRNRADTAVMTPALDLSLTDGQGRLIARKALQGSDLGLPPVLAAGQELPLQATLSAGDKRLSGYTVELFYP
ncbi:MAG: zinc-ribbon domain-containing protein [Aquabacterium sp.]|nr:zinc-ribbon domain-containing protein [Aquabacterium sp.]